MQNRQIKNLQMSRHPIHLRSYKFTLSVVELAKSIRVDTINRSLVSQMIRSGTSVAANLQEADAGISRKDFINKITISLKEARETIYWLTLLKDSNYIALDRWQAIVSEGDEIARILAQIKINSQRQAVK